MKSENQQLESNDSAFQSNLLVLIGKSPTLVPTQRFDRVSKRPHSDSTLVGGAYGRSVKGRQIP
jgi:hypothetical protein